MIKLPRLPVNQAQGVGGIWLHTLSNILNTHLPQSEEEEVFGISFLLSWKMKFPNYSVA